jgi:phosphoribosylglycinamide formyltransferase-1
VSGIPPGDLANQLLQRVGTTKPLQISNHRELTIGFAAPTQPGPFRKLNAQSDRLALVSKACEETTALNWQGQVLKRLHQHVFLAEHGWQDGEMGHGPTSDLINPSEHSLSIQWPLPQDFSPGERRPLRLGVLASGSGSNFEALVEACRRGELPAEVSLLVVNNAGCGAEERAGRLGIPVTLHDHRSYSSREALDQALISSFCLADVDLVVMAGWMRIVTQELIDAFPERLLNIHPSLLPSFRGARAIEQALASGVTLTGCTAHLVSLDVDTGPILVQAAVPVLADDTLDSLSSRIHHQEHRILPQAVQIAAQRLGLLHRVQG